MKLNPNYMCGNYGFCINLFQCVINPSIVKHGFVAIAVF